MAQQKYDPAKRRERYLLTRELKGRKKGSKTKTSGSGPLRATVTNKPKSQAVVEKARIGRLESKVETLQGALTRASVELTRKRIAEKKALRESSDGKSTTEEKRASKEYRDKNRAKIAAESSKSSSSTSSGGGTTTSSSKSVSSMSTEELETRIIKIKSALSDAKRQLSNAQQNLGKLAHSAITSEPLVNDHFARFQFGRKDPVTMTVKADFSGYATRNDLQCSDGRTIKAGAFAGNDGAIVPLVWAHGHDDAENVLGHVKLENRDDGVYCHAFFNETAKGKHAKEMVRHGDVKFLSIFANGLKEKILDRAQNLRDVMHGNIKEVSLVLAGANPGAYIDAVNIVHGDGDAVYVDEAIITTGFEIEPAMAHAETDTLEEDKKADTDVDDNAGNDLEEILDTLNPQQERAVTFLLSQALLKGGEANVKHSDDDNEAEEEDEEVEEEVVETSDSTDESDDDADASSSSEEGSNDSTEGESADDNQNDEAGDETVQHNDNQEDNSMTQNVFDQAQQNGSAIQHGAVALPKEDVQSIIKHAEKLGSLKEAVHSYMAETGIKVGGELKHGIENIDYLFPDAQVLENSPAFIARRMEWVDKVLSAVRKTPFSRIKTVTADITPDEARARGYITGNMKKEEFFALAKRETTPQTIYKKQKLDRDDVIDITTLDVVAWLKTEMKMMLDEELAAAILFGDGRSFGDDDKIKETNIRPVASDAELYVTTVPVNMLDASSSAEELVDAAIANRQYYKGTGNPVFYTSETIVAKFLTVKDNFGRRIYSTMADIAAVLRCSEVVTVEAMDRVPDLVGIMVNLADYTLGADRGGQATMFDDFDLDYNKMIYLIETRVSGALTKPKAALVFRQTDAASVQLAQPAEPTFEANEVTVPTVTGVTYKDGAGNTLTTAAPVVLDPGEELHVKATANSGYHFPNDAEDEWDYTGV